MHLKQIEAFAAVVRCKSFSKAAEAIYLSQPTISVHINSLEEEFETKLLIRSTKEVLPTAAGKILYGYSVEILNLMEKAKLDIKSCLTDVSGTLHVAAATVPSQYILPRVMPLLLEKYPGVFLSLNQYDSIAVIKQVSNMEAEIGITSTKTDRADCVFEPFFSDKMVIVTPNTPEYQALNGVMTLDVLKNAPYVVREPGSGTRRESEVYLEKTGINPKSLTNIAQLEGTESVKQAVKNGVGIAIMSRIAAADMVSKGDLLQFDFPSGEVYRDIYFVYNKNHSLSPAAEAFKKEVSEYLKHEYDHREDHSS